MSFRPRQSAVSHKREEKREVPDRDLPVSILPRDIRPHEDAAACQRGDAEFEQSAAVSPHYGSRSARVHHHCAGHAGEVFGEHTQGHDQVRGGYECEITTSGDMPIHM